MVVLGAALAAALSACAQGTGWVEVHQRRLVGRELRLLLTTSRQYRPPLSHSSRVADVQGWLLIVDLASNAPLKQRARLVGPLWESSTARSWVNFSAGAVFTSADERAVRETPGFTFDRDGALLRFRQQGHERVRERLDLGAAGPSWARLGTVRPIDDRTEPFSEDRVESADGRHALVRQNGRAQLFDLFTGARIEDTWLTTAFQAVRSIPKFENVPYFLTDDVSHLVANPVTVYNDGTPNGDGVRTFEWDGRTYPRAEAALVFRRPDPRAQVLLRPNDPERFRDEPPNEVFVDNGQLLLFDSRPTWMRLSTVDGREVSRVDAAGHTAWPSGLISGRLLLPDTDEVAQRYEPEGTSVREATEQFVLWNYRTGAVTGYTVPVASLFEADGAQLRPRVSPLAVQH